MENIDVIIGENYNRQQVLQKYAHALRQLRALAECNYHIRPFYFDQYVLLHYLQPKSGSKLSSVTNATICASALAYVKDQLFKLLLDRRRQILYLCFYISLLLLCVLAYRHESSTTLGEHSRQSLLYPGMRLWRRLTLPLIKKFPRLTELYDESCLMENPFFQVDDLSCEACAHVKSVLDLTDQHENKPNSVPYIIKIGQKTVQLSDFYKVYARNEEAFQRDAYRVLSTNSKITNLAELFQYYNNSNAKETHSLWRSNRMVPARLLRSLFVRNSRLPSTGLALERFVAIDTAHAPSYTLPDTECANAYIQQALGTRFIILRPTSECRHRCRTLSVRLPHMHVLSYNWWYWKPISAPDPVADMYSISLIGSYC